MSSLPFLESEPESDDNLVTLLDDQDNEITFRVLTLVEVDEDPFVLLTPADADDPDEMEIYIFSYVVDEEAGTVTYGAVEDETLFAKVVAKAEELISYDEE